MKKSIITVVSLFVVLLLSCNAKPVKPVLKNVVFLTTIECENCARKVRENVSFEKGVRDLKIDVPSKTVGIQFDANKTDTLTLKKSINKLGYKAVVVDYK